MATAGYRIYRKGETTAAEHDLQTLRNNLKRARRQEAELREMAADTRRSEENRAACLKRAELYAADTIPYELEMIEQAKAGR